MLSIPTPALYHRPIQGIIMKHTLPVYLLILLLAVPTNTRAA